jgi:hypothetical protein
VKTRFTRLSCMLGIAMAIAASSQIVAQAETANSGLVNSETGNSASAMTHSFESETVVTNAASLQPLSLEPRSLEPLSFELNAAPNSDVIAQTPTDPRPSTPGSVTPEDTVPPPAAAPAPRQTVPSPTPAPSSNSDRTTRTLGRATRSGPSYVGVGGNIGLGDGDTALGEGSFAVFSKIGILPYLSVRPSVLVSDNPTILLPVTFDFIPGITPAVEGGTERIGFRASPFIGAGIAISTGDDSSVDFLATGGVDIPFAERFTGTASVSASLFDNPAVGLLLGVGYNF